MATPGAHEFRLFDGTCIVDTLVEASPRDICAVFGRPVNLAEGGSATGAADPAEIAFWAASWPGIEWSVIEAASDPGADQDYIVTMLRQAGAAIAGNVLDLPRAYENGLGAAREAARALGTRAVAIWGSDEWYALGGGAQLDSEGRIVRACSIAGPEEIARALMEREAPDDEDFDDEDELDDEGEAELFVFTPGAELARVQTGAIEYLDAWFKELGAAQPELTPSLLDHAACEFGEVWGARR